MKTKEKIILESLELFSIYGYDKTSIKQIANSVKIKDSSLYKHFQSKKDILDNIFTYVENYILEYNEKNNYPNYKESNLVYKKINLIDLIDIAQKMFEFYTQDKLIVKFRKMIFIEQYKNNDASKLYQLYFLEGPLLYEESIFEYLLDQKILTNGFAKYMAYEFYSFLFLLMQLYDNNLLINEKELISNHVSNFWNKYHV